MKFLNYDKLEKDYINGLDVYLVNSKDSKFMIDFYVKTGAFDLKAYRNNKLVKFKTGIHHFIEHSLFMKEDYDSMEIFNDLGLKCNASTGYFSTNYYISGSSNFEEGFKYLIDLVVNPYFSQKNVKKERGIIYQEYKLGKDDISTELGEKVLKMLFHKYPLNKSIVGTSRDILGMTYRDLEECYNTYYDYSNMVLLVASNYSKKKVMDILKKELPYKESQKVEKYNYKEKEDVVKKRDVLKSKITSNNKLLISYKIKNQGDIYKNSLLLDIYLSLLFGNTSQFYEYITLNNLATNFSFSLSSIKDFIVIDFWMDTSYADILKEQIEKVLKEEVSEEDFLKKKQVCLDHLCLVSEKAESIIYFLVDNLENFGEIKSSQDQDVKNLKYQDLKKVKKLLANKKEVVLKVEKTF